MRTSLTALVICLACLLNCLVVGSAQQQDQQPPPVPQIKDPKRDDVDVVKISTNLVQVDAVVSDSKGQRVTDLRPDEVEILEDGKTQKISNFTYVNLESKPQVALETGSKSNPNAPPAILPSRLRPNQVRRAIALVVDDLGLSADSVYYVRETLRKFIDQQIQSDDLVAVVRTGSGIGALQGFTSDKRQLYAAVARVVWNPLGRGGMSAFKQMGVETTIPSLAADRLPAGTVMPDMDQFREDLFSVGTLGSIYHVVQGLAELPGRKSVVLVSDGFQIFTKTDPEGNARLLAALRKLTDFANRASVVIYTMDPRGQAMLEKTGADLTWNLSPAQVEAKLKDRRTQFFESQSGLDYLAHQTGGFSVRNTNDLNGGIKRIIADQDGYYLIGFRPDESTFDAASGRSKFHDISLRVKRPGKFNVRMRTGFFGHTNEAITASTKTPQEQVSRALTSPFGASEVQVRLTSYFINQAKLGSAMQSVLHVDARDLNFTEEPNGTRKAAFDVVAVIFGDNGKVVDQFSYAHTIQVKNADFPVLQRNGFNYNMTTPIKSAGAYQLRTALRDASSGKIGSASQFIEVPNINSDRLLLSGVLIKGVPIETYLKDQGLKYEGLFPADNNDVTNTSATSAVRQFRTGMALLYGVTIYNAQIDKTTAKPQLKLQARLFKDGKQVFTGSEIAYDPTGQTDLKRLGAVGAVQLGTVLDPGEYVLQVVVTDTLAKEKNRTATQWIDFEILK